MVMISVSCSPDGAAKAKVPGLVAAQINDAYRSLPRRRPVGRRRLPLDVEAPFVWRRCALKLGKRSKRV